MRYVRLSLVVLVVLIALVPLAGCRRAAPEGEVWFVQATDPHVFLTDNPKNPNDGRVRPHQEKLNQEAFSAFITSLDNLPGGDPEPAFLVVSGDFGLDRFFPKTSAPASAPPTQQAAGGAAPPAETPASEATPASTPTTTPITTPITTPTTTTASTPTPTPTPSPEPAPSASADSAVKYLVGVLGKSPVKKIYLVPGNNDVAGEEPGGEEVAKTRAFWNRVRQGLAGTGVTLHDLTSCYFEEGADCHADVTGTPYRLIGFPSHSFKNEDGLTKAREDAQQAQIQKLQALVAEAAGQGKRVLIVTHIPELDDPYDLAQNEMALQRELAKPEKRATWSLDRPDWAASSAWNVRKVVFDEWRKVVGSRAVAGVLAGHFHDSHKEIYRPPYEWATPSAERASLDKLYLAPPLSMRLQDTSPIQARGFALFRLKGGDDPERVLFWYDRKGKTFEREEPARRVRTEEPGTSFGERIRATARQYWRLATEPMDLARAAVLAIAFLAAFLTIVELWEIPPPRTPLASGAAQPAATTTTTTTATSTTTVTRDFTAFQSNFVKTVLAGLGGMLALTFLDSLWQAEGMNAKAYYVVLFITFFFVMLLLYALLQALIEALRSRILTQHPVRPWRPTVPRGDGSGGASGGGGGAGSRREIRFRLSYWRLRIWDWVLSLRAFFLIFFDTFFNVLRGRNQLRTVVFEKAIIDLHWGIVRAADRIREEIERAILQAMNGKAKDDDIRVSVSMLSDDESVLFYLAREQGSLGRGFDKRSVAWVAVYTDRALWWEKDYPPDTELLDNTSGGYPLLPAEKILLGAYYQTRTGQDYDGFIVLTVPWARRATSDIYRKACIQISFRSKAMMDALFRLPEADDRPLYSRWTSLLDDREPENPECPWLLDAQVRNVLRHSLLILEDLLTPFNETVFDMYVRPQLRAR